MADPIRSPDFEDTDMGFGHGPAVSTPRWVKAFGIFGVVLLLLGLSAMLTGIGAPHGPGRHMASGHATDPGQWGHIILIGVLVLIGVALNWNALPRFTSPSPLVTAGGSLRGSHSARGWRLPTMTSGIRKLALTVHITSSVGSLGAVGGFCTVAVAGLISPDAQMVRAAYLTMELTARLVVVPLILASLLTGVVSSLGTPWGLFRHHWVLMKFLLTVFTNVVLWMQMEAISAMAGIAAETAFSSADLGDLRRSLVLHAGGGLLVLLVATTLAVYKPRGLTAYGWRRRHEHVAGTSPTALAID